MSQFDNVEVTDTGIEQNGWQAVPVNPSKIFGEKPYNQLPTALLARDIIFPHSDPVVSQTYAYVKERLPPETLNHSMRVYYYGAAILKQQFPTYADLSSSTLALASLLHDLGTTEHNLTATRMSFEFFGAIEARSFLLEAGASRDTADAVCETIIRHQDIGTDGNITFLGQLVQLATVYDNVSAHPHMDDIAELLHAATRESVIDEFPRRGWLGCFAGTVRREVGLKPWCHTTHIPEFAERIEVNSLMRPYE